MSKNTSIIIGVVAIIVVVGLIWVGVSSDNVAYRGGPGEDRAVIQNSQPQPQSEVIMSASADTSNQGIDQDSASIDAQMSGLNSDSAAASQSIQ